MLGDVHLEHQGLRGQLPPSGGSPASVLDGLLTLTRPRPHLFTSKGSPHPDCCRRREHHRRAPKKRRMPPRHPGRPISSMHRSSDQSRSFVLAPLRALHLDHPLRAGARHDQGLDTRTPHKKRRGRRRGAYGTHRPHRATPRRRIVIMSVVETVWSALAPIAHENDRAGADRWTGSRAVA